MNHTLVLASVMLLPAASAYAQNAGGGILPPNEVDQAKVDLAIEKGMKFLKARNAGHLRMFPSLRPP